MKWNITLVLVCGLLLTIRFLFIHEYFGSNGIKQQIKITPLIIKKGKLESDSKRTELLTFDNLNLTKEEQEKRNLKGASDTRNPSKIGREGENLHVSMYSRRPFENEKYEFAPSDKIYISLVFPNLKAGDHNIVTHWKTPWGMIARKIVRETTLENDVERFNVYFWFQLVENGLFTEMFTGDAYKKKVYGKWEVLFYLNNEQIGRKYFVVADM